MEFRDELLQSGSTEKEICQMADDGHVLLEGVEIAGVDLRSCFSMAPTWPYTRNCEGIIVQKRASRDDNECQDRRIGEFFVDCKDSRCQGDGTHGAHKVWCPHTKATMKAYDINIADSYDALTVALSGVAVPTMNGKYEYLRLQYECRLHYVLRRTAESLLK